MTVRNATLIATVLNAGEALEPFLSDVASLDPAPAQIVVVDGGSVDGTVARLESWAAGRDDRVVVSAPGANIAAGRNLAVRHAAHPIIVVTDIGTRFAAAWLGELVDGVEGGASVASGWFVPGGSTPFELMLGSIITPTIQEIDPAAFLPSSRSVAFTREAWERVGGYPEWLDYCEDLVFDMAMRDAGLSFEFRPDAVVEWDARSSLRGFAKQYYRYARGDGKAAILGRRHAIRYAAYSAGALLTVMAAGGDRRALGVLASLGSLYLSPYVRRVVRRREVLGPRTVPTAALVPVILVVGDLAKMVGYPVGRRWRRDHAVRLRDVSTRPQ